MKIHILGIGGTFMGGLALLARAAGHEVSGSDTNVYPPMSEQLREAGITYHEGYEPADLTPAPELVVIGNALSRGNPLVEHVLDAGIPYTSGPQWLAENVLRGRWVLAVAGTHGKTSTSSMLAWILEVAGLEPGFLIGGIPLNFGVSARLGAGEVFVVEADEYDTAFFDKRSKFVHYRPRTLVMNNLEYDHADIFPDLGAIELQFHHLVRTVPSTGLIICPADDEALRDTLARGCWTPVETVGLAGADWEIRLLVPDGSHLEVLHRAHPTERVEWELIGEHNALNALSSIVAANHVGVGPERSAEALKTYRSVRRRLELRAAVHGITVYDDFAHHPTAVRATIEALRQRIGGGRILAILEPRSNSMRLGVHRNELVSALAGADLCFVLRPEGLEWDLDASLAGLDGRARTLPSVESIVQEVTSASRAGDHLLVMSNGGFGGIHELLARAIEQRHAD